MTHRQKLRAALSPTWTTTASLAWACALPRGRIEGLLRDEWERGTVERRRIYSERALTYEYRLREAPPRGERAGPVLFRQLAGW